MSHSGQEENDDDDSLNLAPPSARTSEGASRPLPRPFVLGSPVVSRPFVVSRHVHDERKQVAERHAGG